MVGYYRDLHDFISRLEAEGELLRIKFPVSTNLEITEITDIASKARNGGKALLFENVVGHRFPVLTNAFGSYRRMAMALGVSDIEKLSRRFSNFMKVLTGKNEKGFINVIGRGLDFIKALPRRWKSGTPPCQEVIYKGADVDLGLLPVLKCWPKDGGPFITLPAVITKSLEAGSRNVGMYRLQVYDKKTTGMHWHLHKDGSHFFQEYRKAKKKMPVAVAIGADPATIYAATAPLPRGVDELIFAGLIRKKPVPLAKCVTIDMEVPAYADFVLEGFVDPEELRREGPFGDHTGYYSLEDDYPVFHVTAITHRKNPIYPATIVGPPPMEDCYMAKATERVFLPLLQALFPEITDYWLPWEGVFHNITVVAIKKEYPRHAHKIMNALWGQGQMAFCKAIMVVDHQENIKNPSAIVEHFLNNVDFQRDLLISEGILDALDHSAPNPFYGSKIGLDATAPHPLEGKKGIENPFWLDVPLPRKEELPQILNHVSPAVKDCFIPEIKTVHRPLILSWHKPSFESKALGIPSRTGHILLDHPRLKCFSIFVILDEGVDIRSYSKVFWKIFNNVDPKRDLLVKEGRAVVVATKKGIEEGHCRPWPDDIIMDPTVRDYIRRKAHEIGIEEFLKG